MTSWLPGRRTIIGLIVGAVTGLFLGILRSNTISESRILDTITMIGFGAFCGAIIADKSRDRLIARNIIVGALAGLTLAVLIGLAKNETSSLVLLRNAINDALVGAVIGSELRKAVRGAKIGASIGAGLGLIFGIAFVVKEGIPMTMKVGIFPLQVAGPVYVLAYTTFIGFLVGALFLAFLKSVF